MTGRLGYVRPISVKPLAKNVRMVPVNSAEPLTRRRVQQVGVHRMSLDGGCAVSSGVSYSGVEEGGRDAAGPVPPIDREACDPPGAGVVDRARGATPDWPERRVAPIGASPSSSRPVRRRRRR